jgi:hypothetical protein
MGTPRPGARLVGGAGPEVHEDLAVTDAWVMQATMHMAPQKKNDPRTITICVCVRIAT